MSGISRRGVAVVIGLAIVATAALAFPGARQIPALGGRADNAQDTASSDTTGASGVLGTSASRDDSTVGPVERGVNPGKDKPKDKPGKPGDGQTPVDPVPPSDPGTSTPPPDPTEPPALPGVVAAVSCVSADMADVITFSSPRDGGEVETFVLAYAGTPEGPFSVVATATADASSFTIPVSEPARAFYTVAARNAAGTGPASEAAENAQVAIERMVGTGGATVRSSNGEVALVLPPGAFETSTTVGVKEVPGAPGSGIISLAGVYEITPSGPLGTPATLSVAYTLAVTHHQVSATLLKAATLLTFDTASGAWVPGATGTHVEGGYIAGEVSHFSEWTPGTIQPHGTSGEAVDYCSGVCHDLTTYPGSTVRYGSRDPQICYNCHGNPTLSGAPLGAPGENVQGAITGPWTGSRHPVVLGGFYCTACHDPHADPDSSPGLLKSWDPVTGRYVTGGAGTTPGEEYCWTCHGSVNNRRIDQLVSGYYLRAGGDRKTGYIGKPHSAIETDGPISCRACHAEHGSDGKAIMDRSVETPSGTVAVTSESGMCLACHTTNTDGYPGSAVAGASKHVTTAVSTRALTKYPSAEGEGNGCTGCHEPHGKGSGPGYTWVAGRALCLTCHDAAGVTYAGDYSYQGAATFDDSGHAGITGALSYLSLGPSSQGFAAWQSATPPTPSSPGTPVDAAGMTLLGALDGQHLTTAVQTTRGAGDYQMYRFSVPDDVVTPVVTASLSWSGYGEETPGYPVSLSVWVPATGTWEQLDSRVLPSTQNVTVQLRPADHVDGNGDVYVMAKAPYVYDGELLSGPTVTGLWAGAYRFDWVTAGNTTSLLDWGTTTAYGNVAGSDARSTNHSVLITGLTGPQVYHFRARSESPQGENYISADIAFGYPSPSGLTSSPTSPTWLGSPVGVTLSWAAMSPPTGPMQYRVRVGTFYSPWSTSNSYYFETNTPGSYSWQVEARDAAGVPFGMSPTANFTIIDGLYTGSCPFLFVDAGEEFAFEADLFTAGRIGGASSGGFQQANPNDAYVLSSVPETTDGVVRMRLVEERYEVDYIDSFKVYAVDAPEGAAVYAQKAVAGVRTFPSLADAVHTVRSPQQVVSATRLDTGEDVSTAIATDDGVYLELNENRETDFSYKTLELDLGDEALSAPQVKVIMDAVSEFPVTPEGIARRFTFGLPTRLEVQDTDGTWRIVPAATAAVPVAPEFTRPYVFDLTKALTGTTGKVRFTYLFRTLVDSVELDLTADEPLEFTELTLDSADLRQHGVDRETGSAGEARFEYGVDLRPGAFFPGLYTRYGEVAGLLGANDDMFVIMGQGDEIALTYRAADPPASGTSRFYVVSPVGYYKDLKTDVPKTVEPLPFAAMSNYPYAEAESYPADDAHETYRAEYNTRVDGGVPGIAPAEDLVAEAEPAEWRSFHSLVPLASAPLPSSQVAAAPATEVDHRSLNTDAVSLLFSFESPGGSGGECGSCHSFHGASENGTMLTGGRIANDGATCTQSGSGGCHDNAANSATGVNISDEFTASADPRTHHDVFPADQLATGGKTACADCHNPHTNNGVAKVSDPDDMSKAMGTALGSAIDDQGRLFVLVGAAHDAVPPTISSVAIDGTGAQYATPTVTWTTNEGATTWVEWGLTTDYEGGAVGNNAYVTSHSIQLSLTPGSTYHYRVRSADALGNTSYSADAIYIPVVPPPTPVPSAAANYPGPGLGPITVAVSCSAVTADDGCPVLYEFQFDGSDWMTSGWIASTSYTSGAWFFNGSHTVRVRARHLNHADSISAWSAPLAFTVSNSFYPPSSCPFLFTWNGNRFGYETDIYTTGKLGSARANGTYQKPNPHDYYVLDNEPELKEGAFELRLVEEILETDYLDEFKLYAVDVPAGTDIAAEKIAQGASYEPLTDIVHTISADVRNVPATLVGTAEDVTGKVAAPDGECAVLGDDPENAAYHSLELDLGDFSAAEAVKLVFEGVTRFPETDEGKALGMAGVRQKVEVIGTDGQWVALPGEWPKPAEFARPYVLDLTGKFPTSDHRVRLTFLLQTYVDCVRLDTTADVALAVTEAPLLSARLQRHGRDALTLENGLYEYEYGAPNGYAGYFPGNYTRFGDVTPLVETSDDMFAIFGGGDEVVMRFDEPTPAAAGMDRHYVIYANGYYKDYKSAVELTVEPLPFSTMSNYPYTANEQYPDDDAHRAYRAEWNTRVEVPTPYVGATAAEGVGFAGTHFQLADIPEDLYSVDTDYAAIRTLVGTTAAYIAPAAGWSSTSAASAPPTPAAPGEAVDAATLARTAADDGTYWQTNLAATDKSWNWQVLRFDLGADALDQLKALSVLWNGHGEPTTGYATSLHLWNPESGAWVPLDSRVSGTDYSVMIEKQALAEGYCIKCHDGAPPSGVVFPAGSKNVGGTWALPTGDFHGAGAGSGLGTSALQAPYNRSQAAISCNTCHESHGSANLYHFPTWLNGKSGIVATTGANTVAMCSACHVPNGAYPGQPLADQYHRACLGCHWSEGHGWGTFDNSDCLSCHKHNSTWDHQVNVIPGAYDDWYCHCGVPGPYKTF